MQHPEHAPRTTYVDLWSAVTRTHKFSYLQVFPWVYLYNCYSSALGNCPHHRQMYILRQSNDEFMFASWKGIRHGTKRCPSILDGIGKTDFDCPARIPWLCQYYSLLIGWGLIVKISAGKEGTYRALKTSTWFHFFNCSPFIPIHVASISPSHWEQPATVLYRSFCSRSNNHLQHKHINGLIQRNIGRNDRHNEDRIFL